MSAAACDRRGRAGGNDDNGVNGNQADNSASGSGAAYVFTRNGTVWTQQAYLKASNAQAGDLFGVDVAISGDTLVVGATGEASSAAGVNRNQANNGAAGSGAAYVFTRSGTAWTQQAYLKASNTDAGDNFGSRVAIEGDTIAVSAIREASRAGGVDGDQANDDIAAAGAVYVFTRNAGTWRQQAYLKPSNTVGSHFVIVGWFGSALAISGETLVVGAMLESSSATGVNGPQFDNGAPASGAAYVFTRSAGAWSQQAYLKASNTGAGDHFGNSVALDGDALAVGALGEDSRATGSNGDQTNDGAVDSGAAYVFARTGGVWSQRAYLTASNSGAGDHFSGVALTDKTLAVGADWEAQRDRAERQPGRRQRAAQRRGVPVRAGVTLTVGRAPPSVAPSGACPAQMAATRGAIASPSCRCAASSRWMPSTALDSMSSPASRKSAPRCAAMRR